MARNAIQLQKGLSLSELNESYGTEEKCAAAIFKWRWPDGFVCPACGSRDHAIVGARQLYLCHDCLTQTSLKSGTIFARTLLPYVKWFQGMYLLTQSKNSVSTLEMARQLGVRPDTAALMRHKLMSVMAEREGSRKLDGRVEMDDAVRPCAAWLRHDAARKARRMAANAGARGPTRPPSWWPSRPAMTGDRCACCCMW